jgi:FAD/FMN-containing dehydrogenase
MTRLFGQAVAGLPEAEQDDYARLLLRLVGSDPTPVHLTAEEDADLAEAEREAARGECASEEEIAALWAKYRG